jgi:hypothetical protein
MVVKSARALARHASLKSLATLAALTLLQLPPVARAQHESKAQAAAAKVESVASDIDSRLTTARTHMSSLRYEQAIALLEPVLLAEEPPDRERRRETYLLLIEAHVYRGNLSAAGTKEQQLWYEEARNLVRECLSVSELRHTRPDPPERYPAEMLRFFDDVRRELFGSFEIAILDPADAEVTFDGVVLPALADGTRRAASVPVGTHALVVRRDGYEEITEQVRVNPASVVTRSYELKRKRGVTWYATRIVAPVAVVAATVVAVTRKGDEPDLPGPPAPPDLR